MVSHLTLDQAIEGSSPSSSAKPTSSAVGARQTVPSSSGQDTGLSRRERGFDSRWDHQGKSRTFSNFPPLPTLLKPTFEAHEPPKPLFLRQIHPNSDSDPIRKNRPARICGPQFIHTRGLTRITTSAPTSDNSHNRAFPLSFSRGSNRGPEFRPTLDFRPESPIRQVCTGCAHPRRRHQSAQTISPRGNRP